MKYYLELFDVHTECGDGCCHDYYTRADIYELANNGDKFFIKSIILDEVSEVLRLLQVFEYPYKWFGYYQDLIEQYPKVVETDDQKRVF